LGISITLIGAIERTPPDEFVSTRVQLAPSGTMKEPTVLEFDFGNVRFPFPSYDGAGVSLRYFVRVAVHRKLSDMIKETTLWCPTVYESIEMSPSVPVEIDVGLEEFLHIKMRLDRSQFLFTDEIHGMMQFLLVRVRVIDVAVTLVRKELDGNNEVIEQTILASRQILDGSAYRGDVLPVYLDLAALGTKMSPTMSNINGTFSVRYYVGLVLRDAENRKYYKQVEIMLRRPEHSVLYPVLPDYRLGLTVQ
jgi:vacuolar protein sorting-associated protein 26